MQLERLERHDWVPRRNILRAVMAWDDGTERRQPLRSNPDACYYGMLIRNAKEWNTRQEMVICHGILLTYHRRCHMESVTKVGCASEVMNIQHYDALAFKNPWNMGFLSSAAELGSS